MRTSAATFWRRADARDEGFALLTVLGSMTIITIFLLTTLAYAMQNTKPSRADQDSKAATAAAQAGIEEFVSRLNADDTYYTNNGVDPSNPAFAEGMSIPGTTGAGATFSYRLLTTDVQTGTDGLIRLKVTGKSNGVSRDLVATLRPDGFLKYIYFTDLEVGDPTLYNSGLAVRHNGDLTRTDAVSMGKTVKITYTWQATPALVDAVCSSYYYAVRHARTFTTGQYIEIAQQYDNKGNPRGTATTTVKDADATHKITLDCLEIQFTGSDSVAGPMHSNDALQITGATSFGGGTTSSWGVSTTTSPLATPLAAPADGKLWWGNKTLTLPGSVPEPAGVVPLPTSNDALRRKANPLSPDFGPGCLYTGQTRITFVGTMMKVLSPGTVTSHPRCYNTGARGTEQTVAIPPVIYVQGGPCGTVGVGYPRVGEDTGPGRWTTKYDCSYGTAFVSGTLTGRVTIGTSHDIVVTGDTTYSGGMTGSDALGLIPQGFAWVYHPVDATGTNLLPYNQAVRKIDAAILSVGHSFIVQNFFNGAALSTSTDASSKLQVRGSILQKFRGPVGSPPQNAGYLKNYIYDARLLNSPPPYFLRPLSSPWKVSKVTS